MPNKELLIVGGPNGAGKSTFVTRLLRERPRPYLCADLIAKEFSHLDVLSQQVEAGRAFLHRIEAQLARGEDFIIESTLSGRTLKNFLIRARDHGFEITIMFVYLDSPETCVARVRDRVRRGGHDVPKEDILRRFNRSCTNFWRIYREIADYWYIVYNSSGALQWVATGEPSAVLVHDTPAFLTFLRFAGASDAEIES